MKLGSFAVTLMVVALFTGRADALTNLYSTQFSAAEGYDPKYELAGQAGWVTDSLSFGGNGLLTNYNSTQAAYVGLFPLDPPTDSISVWQPINFHPLEAALPLVKFSVMMTVVDSTTTNRDDFRWSVYNSLGSRLFTLSFYNEDLGTYYLLNGTNDTFLYTGVDFTNDVVYTLNLAMDYARNRWSATLNGLLLATNQPITTTNLQLDLGDIDAVWYVTQVDAPGDNFMIFDNYQVTAEASHLPPGPARLSKPTLDSTGQCSMVLTGTPGYRYALDATTNFIQWTALRTNTIVTGSVGYTDTTAGGFNPRFYRARNVP
jgi:hypothetical protein